MKCHPNGELLWGVLVGTEGYSQDEPTCHGHRRRSASNETLFGEPGRFYVYLSYGIHHCVNRMNDSGLAAGKSAQRSKPALKTGPSHRRLSEASCNARATPALPVNRPGRLSEPLSTLKKR
jgi:DNA-3-methyladenine glycosylase